MSFPLWIFTQTLKVLRTAEFMPYVVFIAAPEFETLRAMHKAAADAGITSKPLTVRTVQIAPNQGKALLLNSTQIV